MSRILVVEPENYDDLIEELEEVGVDYDRATEEEAYELFSHVDYDAVVSPDSDELYVRAMDDETLLFTYEGLTGDDVTDNLTGEAEFDARRLAAYTGDQRFQSYTRDLADITESHDDKDFVMSMIVHDVKNNANLIRGYFNQIDIDQDYQNEKEIVNENVDSILEMMETMEAVEERRNKKEEDVDMSDVLMELEQSVEKRACGEGFDLNFNVEENIEVSAGPLLKDMYCQLIENSLNHSEGSEIRVRAEDGERPLVVVEDDGKGIPEEIRDNIFQAGVKGEETGNTGIGTKLVDVIADRYDIDLEVGDSELGGAKFEMYHQPADHQALLSSPNQ